MGLIRKAASVSTLGAVGFHRRREARAKAALAQARLVKEERKAVKHKRKTEDAERRDAEAEQREQGRGGQALVAPADSRRCDPRYRPEITARTTYVPVITLAGGFSGQSGHADTDDRM